MANSTILIQDIFKTYCFFFNSDIEAAVLEDRNFDIIDLFRVNLALILDENIDINYVKESFDTLNKVVKEDTIIYTQLNIYQQKDILLNATREIFEEVKSYFVDFILAYDLLYSSIETIEEGSYDRKFQDLLVELNNAMAHLLVAIVNKCDFALKDSNIKRAISHLHRGILDAYKEVIGINNQMVNRVEEKHKRLRNMSFMEFYIDLREREAQNIGKNENDKDSIVNDYKELAWLLVN